MADRWTNYTQHGYDPRDALTGGEWVYDAARGVQVWVDHGTQRPAPEG